MKNKATNHNNVIKNNVKLSHERKTKKTKYSKIDKNLSGVKKDSIISEKKKPPIKFKIFERRTADIDIKSQIQLHKKS